jgi:CubicO group peptidase (beta-lactamase class C family)
MAWDMPGSLIRRAHVPRDLRAVTRIAAEHEIDPRQLGVEPAALREVWRAVKRLYASGIHPAIGICVRYRGEVLLDRAIGYASGNGPDDLVDAPKVVATPDTPFSILSASKPLAAMMMHLLAERGLIHLDDPVCEYLPEFARHGKEIITIRHSWCTAPLAVVPAEALDLDRLASPRRPPDHREFRPLRRAGCSPATPSPPALGELVRRVMGRDIRAVVRETLGGPLGMRWMNCGARGRRRGGDQLPDRAALSRALRAVFRRSSGRVQ